jgi:hypothetical protein
MQERAEAFCPRHPASPCVSVVRTASTATATSLYVNATRAPSLLSRLPTPIWDAPTRPGRRCARPASSRATTTRSGKSRPFTGASRATQSLRPQFQLPFSPMRVGKYGSLTPASVDHLDPSDFVCPCTRPDGSACPHLVLKKSAAGDKFVAPRWSHLCPFEGASLLCRPRSESHSFVAVPVPKVRAQKILKTAAEVKAWKGAFLHLLIAFTSNLPPAARDASDDDSEFDELESSPPPSSSTSSQAPPLPVPAPPSTAVVVGMAALPPFVAQARAAARRDPHPRWPGQLHPDLVVPSPTRPRPVPRNRNTDVDSTAPKSFYREEVAAARANSCMFPLLSLSWAHALLQARI